MEQIKCNETEIPPHVPLIRFELKKHPITNEMKRNVVRSFLLHILYSRGVIPLLGDDLIVMTKQQQQRQISPPRRRIRRDDNGRKYRKAGMNLGVVLDDLDDLLLFCHSRRSFASRNNNSNSSVDNDDDDKENESYGPPPGVKYVVITLGPSLISPKEQYVIRFFSPTPKDDAICHGGDRRIETEIARRCLVAFSRETTDNSKMFSSVSSAAHKVMISVLLDGDTAEDVLNPRICSIKRIMCRKAMD